MTSRTQSCESCGSPEPADDLRPVRRVYLVTDEGGRVIGERVLADREHWCLPCRTLYPNQPDAGPGPAHGPGPGAEDTPGTGR
jgi:hypothetical protein